MIPVKLSGSFTFQLMVIGSMSACIGAAPADESPRQRISTEVRRILAGLKESHYSHTTHVDESAGIYDVDCSGLLCYTLKQVAPEHLKDIPPSKRHGRPLALQFYETFAGAGTDASGTDGWQHITRLSDARPGDVLVWRKEEQKAGQDTGHVMIVDEAPVADGESLFRVRVIDSCESPHGKDTRAEGATGVGRGSMWFKVDESGQIVGYHWKLRTGKLHDMSVAIGRAVEVNQQTR